MSSRPAPSALDLEVDRLVLPDLGISPARAERIGRLAEAELERLLAGAQLDSHSTAIGVRVVGAPELDLGHSDPDVAVSLARAIARAVLEA
jgi:hypothetical protein